jgi:hypothetical protein
MRQSAANTELCMVRAYQTLNQNARESSANRAPNTNQSARRREKNGDKNAMMDTTENGISYGWTYTGQWETEVACILYRTPETTDEQIEDAKREILKYIDDVSWFFITDAGPVNAETFTVWRKVRAEY